MILDTRRGRLIAPTAALSALSGCFPVPIILLIYIIASRGWWATTLSVGAWFILARSPHLVLMVARVPLPLAHLKEEGYVPILHR